MSLPAKLNNFVDYSRQFIRGDEKSEAQPFLNEFFRAFGYEGARQAGAEFEYRVDKGSLKGNKGYADLVWKARLLVEMKSRGESLKHHYDQVARYWMQITPKPKYSILSNFDEFWIYDFNNQVDTPVDVIRLDELPKRAGAFNFMEHEDARPMFRNNQVEITERNARLMGELYQALVKRSKQSDYRDFDKQSAQRFILQCVLAMFAEDRGLLPQDMFVSCLRDCIEGRGNTYDVLGGLFAAMNQPGITPAGRYKGVEYFNGGLFASIQPIELTGKELEVLENCAKQKWDQVRPSIFGSIFESAIDATDRHAHGIHFTSEADIRQIVIPTITEYWESLIDAANSRKELNQLQQKLINYKVLDPACGSGNFLYIAYQELKKVEMKLLAKLSTYQQSDDKQLSFSFVSPNQFYGMDTNPFAVELARVTMMISRKVAIDDLELKDEPALPLDSLDKNIVCQDALFSDWIKADAIIGNPPFLGGKNIRLEKSDTYADNVFEKFSDVKDSVDYCCYWFRLAHQNLDEYARAGLVGTNSISQGKSRNASLDYITQNAGYIHNAISTQPWSGKAAVHVSIVNWSKQKPSQFRLDSQTVEKINSSLTATVNTSTSKKLKANTNKSFQGINPVGKGFYINEDLAKEWIKTDSKNLEVLKKSLSAGDLTDNPLGVPSRWIIDFNSKSIEDASEYILPFQHIKKTVKPVRDENRRQSRKNNWWKFGENAPNMRKAITNLSCYFTVPRHSKWYIFIPSKSSWLPADSTNIIVSDDFYILSILTSKIHRLWVKAQSSTLEDRIRYTHNTCFETFPFPQVPSQALIVEIRSVMQDLHQYRSEIMESRKWGITALYNAFFDQPASRLYKLHAELDNLVAKAYGFQNGEDILERLLELNLELAGKEQCGEPVVGAWAPVQDTNENIDYSITRRLRRKARQA